MSSEGPPVPIQAPVVDPPQGNGDEAQCKEEVPRDGVEDLTLDEEAEEPPAVGHNDVVRSKYSCYYFVLTIEKPYTQIVINEY